MRHRDTTDSHKGVNRCRPNATRRNRHACSSHHRRHDRRRGRHSGACRTRGSRHSAEIIRLDWSAGGTRVDIYRDASLLASVANNGTWTGKPGSNAAATWRVCNADTLACSTGVVPMNDAWTQPAPAPAKPAPRVRPMPVEPRER